MKKHKKIYIIFTILISILSIALVNKSLQNDTFSAITIGKYILNHGIDFVEHFNIQNDLKYHNARYLFNILIALIYKKFNFFGIYVFVCLIIAILGNTIFNVLLKLKNNIVVSFLITVLTLFFSYEYFTARAQIISYLFLLVELYSIEMLIKTNKKRYIIYIILSSILIANFHTTIWLMTLVLFLPYFAEYILSKIKYINKNKFLYYEDINIKILLITFILTILSGFCTPLGTLPYTYIFKTMGGISPLYIDELSKANLFKTYNLLYYTILYIGLFIYTKFKIKMSDLFLLIGLYIMGLLAVRNISFFIILTSIPLSRLVNNIIIKNQEKVDNLTDKLNNKNIILIFTIIYTLIVSSIYFYNNNITKKYVDESNYPTKAVKYIEKNIDKSKMRLFNEFDYGAYLEFKGIKVFLDSRSEVFCKEFNDTTVLEDWFKASFGNSEYEKIFDKYKFTHIMVSKKAKTSIKYYMPENDHYKLLYEDKYFALYEKIK